MVAFIELRLYNPADINQYVLLPNFSELAFDKAYNAISAIQFAYPLSEAKALALTDQSLVGVVTGFDDGSYVEVERYILETTNDEKVKDDIRLRAFTGRSLLAILDDAVVYPSNWPVTVPTGHEFVTSTPGTIWRTLILRAHNRGAIPFVTETSFSGTVDSNAVAWGMDTTQTFPSGTTYTSILQDMMDRGIVDAKIVGWDLRMYKGGTSGNHIGIGTVEVRAAAHTTDMVTATSSAEACSTVLIEGDAGTAIERNSSAALTLLGRRRERFVSQGGIDDSGVLTILADAELELYGKIPAEETVGITSLNGLEPFQDFDTADWLWVRYESDEAPVERRVRQIAVSVDADRNLTIGLTLNSILMENDIRLLRKIEGYIGSGGSYNGNTSPPSDWTVPNAPTGVNITSGAYQIKGNTYAAMTVSWTAPTLNTDTTAYDDPDGYEWQFKYDANSDWEPLFTSADNIVHFSPMTPGAAIDVRVRAKDTSSNRSAWATNNAHVLADDATPPPTPQAPVASSRMGAVGIYWSGLDSTLAAMPPDFAYAEIHYNTSGSFTPVPHAQATLADTLPGAGTLSLPLMTYGNTLYFKVIAFDRSGNASTASAASNPIVVTALVNTDLIGAVINAASNVLPGTITNPLLAANSVLAHNIVLSDWTNYMVDADMEGNKGIRFASNSATYLASGAGGVPASAPRTTVARLGTRDNIHWYDSVYAANVSGGFTVRPGEVYHTEAYVAADTAVAASPLRIGLWFRTAASADLYVFGIATVNDVVNTSDLYPSEATTWKKITYEVTVPALAVKAWPLFQIENSLWESPYGAGNTNGWYVTQMQVRRKNAGQLIVDGSIFANNIASLAINTGHLQANAVTTPKVAAQAITTEKLSVSAAAVAANFNSSMEDEATVAGVGQGYPAYWTLLYQAGSMSFGMETTSPIMGTKSAKVTFTGSVPNSDQGLVGYGEGSAISVVGGERWFATVKIRSNAIIPAGAELIIHTALPGTSPYAVFDPNASWQGMGTTVTTPANTTREMVMPAITVPAGHSRLTASLRVQSSQANQIVYIDDFVIAPAVGDEQVTEIGAGKIRTGSIQAGVEIISGVLGANRTVLTPAGFQAYNSSNVQTFGILSADGTAYIGPPAGIPRIQMTVVANVFESGQNWALQQYYVQSGWSPGQTWGSYVSDGEGNWGTLRFNAPYVPGSYLTPSFLDLRTRSDGYSSALLRANRVQFSADTFQYTSSAGSIDINMLNTNMWQFINGGGLKLDININGSNSSTNIRSRDASNNPRNMTLTGRDIFLSGTGLNDLVVNSQGSQGNAPIFGNPTKDIAICFNVISSTGALQVTNYPANAYRDIHASAFNVGSDMRSKSKMTPVTDALFTLNAMKVQDYDTDSRIPGAAKQMHNAPKIRARGLIAQELSEVAPELVKGDNDMGFTVDLYGLLATTVAAVQELTKQVNELKKSKGKS